MRLEELPEKEGVLCFSARQKRSVRVAAGLLRKANYKERNELTIVDSRFPSAVKTESMELIEAKAALKALQAEKEAWALKNKVIEPKQPKQPEAPETLEAQKPVKEDEKPEWADLDLKGKKAYAKGLGYEFPKTATEAFMNDLLTNNGK